MLELVGITATPFTVKSSKRSPIWIERTLLVGFSEPKYFTAMRSLSTTLL